LENIVLLGGGTDIKCGVIKIAATSVGANSGGCECVRQDALGTAAIEFELAAELCHAGAWILGIGCVA